MKTENRYILIWALLAMAYILLCALLGNALIHSLPEEGNRLPGYILFFAQSIQFHQDLLMAVVANGAVIGVHWLIFSFLAARGMNQTLRIWFIIGVVSYAVHILGALALPILPLGAEVTEPGSM